MPTFTIPPIEWRRHTAFEQMRLLTALEDGRLQLLPELDAYREQHQQMEAALQTYQGLCFEAERAGEPGPSFPDYDPFTAVQCRQIDATYGWHRQ